MRTVRPARSYPDAHTYMATAVIVAVLSAITLTMLIVAVLSASPRHDVNPGVLAGFLAVGAYLPLAGISLIQAALLRRGLPAVTFRNVGRLLDASTTRERHLIYLAVILFAFGNAAGVFLIWYAAAHLASL